MTIAEIIKKRTAYNNLQNEGGEGYNPFDAILNREIARQAAIPRWTKEQTQSKREAWNKDMRAHGTQITIAQLRAMEAKHGFNFAILKSEVAKHNL